MSRVVKQIFKRAVLKATLAPSADRHYVRQTMDRCIAAKITELRPEVKDAVEVSGDLRAGLGWRSYLNLQYPAFDLTAPPEPLPGPFDVVICEQVLEHVADPIRAVETLRGLCRDDGTLIVNTPFLLRVHGSPSDFWRFTEEGLALLLRRGGFDVEKVESWGNRTAVVTNLFGWTPNYRWLPRGSRSDFPLVVWAFAHPAN